MNANGTITTDLDLGPTGLLIDGTWREASGGETIEVRPRPASRR